MYKHLTGIEPVPSDWKSEIIAIRPKVHVKQETGFEPAKNWVATNRVKPLRYPCIIIWRAWSESNRPSGL